MQGVTELWPAPPASEPAAAPTPPATPRDTAPIAAAATTALATLPSEGFAALASAVRSGVDLNELVRADPRWQEDDEASDAADFPGRFRGRGSFPALRSLHAHGCEGLLSLGGLRHSVELTTLDIGACAGISDLTPLASLVQLRSLNLEGCPALDDESIVVVAGLVELRTVDVSWCKRLRDISALGGCTKLSQVSCHDIAGIRSAFSQECQAMSSRAGERGWDEAVGGGGGGGAGGAGGEPRAGAERRRAQALVMHERYLRYLW